MEATTLHPEHRGHGGSTRGSAAPGPTSAIATKVSVPWDA
jgi:hypothetical protein